MRLVQFTLGYPWTQAENKRVAINPLMVAEVHSVTETECIIALSNHQTPDYWVRVLGSYYDVLAMLED